MTAFAVVHLDLTHAVVLFLAGMAAGAINAIAGGGSLISFPALLSAGYPPVVANVTNTVALVPGYLGGSLGYRSELAGQQDRIRKLGIVSAAGGLVGAAILLASPAAVFRAIVPWLILFSCFLLAVQPKVTRMVRGESQTGSVPESMAWVAQFGAAVYGGYFGAGLGVMMLAILAVVIHDTLQRLNALKGLLSLIINVVSALFFALFGPVAWVPVAIMVAASLIGGNIGVLLARRLSSEVLRVLVIAFGAAVALRLLI